MNMKHILAFLLAALMCLSLCACGRAANASPNYKEAAYEMSAAEMPASMQMNAAYDYDMAYEDAGFGMMSMATSTGARRDADESGTDAPEENPEKIIYSGDATVETTEFEKSVAALEKMIAEAGGFIESSSVNGNNYYDSSRGYTSKRSASYTARAERKVCRSDVKPLRHWQCPLHPHLHRKCDRRILRRAGEAQGAAGPGGKASGDDGDRRDRGGHHHH